MPVNISELREIQFAIAKISGNGHSASVPGRQQTVELTAEWKIDHPRVTTSAYGEETLK